MIDRVVAGFDREPWYRRQIVHVRRMSAAEPVFADAALPASLQAHIAGRGIHLYRHQVEAIRVFREGRDLVLATPTASGKTLAFNLPIVERMINDPQACALYLYPLKALANDQLGKLVDLEDSTGLQLRPRIYDGDTPAAHRTGIKRAARIILTNPHALHQYLPWHHQWARIFSHLSAIVVDEAHHYRGVFGANVAYLLRRLLRVVSRYGGAPQIVLSSASIANPGGFAQALTGRPAVPILESTAGRGGRTIVFWDPQRDSGRSITAQAARILTYLTSNGLQTLCFTRSRAMAEWVARSARTAGHDRILAYRAGYLPAERREIESALRRRDLDAVVSTPALESGIDIGDLDATVLVGFPGSLLSAWQQAGRAGRGMDPSLVVFLPYENPLDRYFLGHPDRFIGQNQERIVVPLGNPRQRAGHLACAAAELPLVSGDLDPTEQALTERLADDGLLARTPSGYIYQGLRRAHDAFPLDDLGGETVRLVHEGRLLETMDPLRARRTAYPGAVLLHRGETYVVDRLDLDDGAAVLRRKDVDYSTHSLRASEVAIVAPEKSIRLGSVGLAWGRVRVTESFVGYKSVHDDRTVSTHRLDLPSVSFDSDAVWISFREGVPGLAAEALSGGLHGAEHALIAMAPLLVLCDAEDLGGVSLPAHPQTQAPTVLLYDDMVDGAGIAETLFSSFPQLAAHAHALVRDCRCDAGCPACVLSPRCGSQNEPISKAAAVAVLRCISPSIAPRPSPP